MKLIILRFLGLNALTLPTGQHKDLIIKSKMTSTDPLSPMKEAVHTA